MNTRRGNVRRTGGHIPTRATQATAPPHKTNGTAAMIPMTAPPALVDRIRTKSSPFGRATFLMTRQQLVRSPLTCMFSGHSAYWITTCGRSVDCLSTLCRRTCRRRRAVRNRRQSFWVIRRSRPAVGPTRLWRFAGNRTQGISQPHQTVSNHFGPVGAHVRQVSPRFCDGSNR
jgi:hypothetical protein